jgi:hypothetical protein
MPSAKLVVASGLAALALSACGSITVKPTSASGIPASRGRIDDPRTTKNNHVACLRKAGLSVAKIGGANLQVGAPGSGPMVLFTPTPGAAQADQIQGYRWAQGAEVIGSALVYPNQASDSELGKVETCVATGVSG